MKNQKKISGFFSGLITQVIFDPVCIKLQSISDDIVQVHNFLHTGKLESCCSDIELCFFMPSKPSQVNGKILLIHQKIVYRQIDDKLFQLFEFADEKQDKITWLINCNKNFSRFQYFFLKILYHVLIISNIFSSTVSSFNTPSSTITA
jgi:hypothetical protein